MKEQITLDSELWREFESNAKKHRRNPLKLLTDYMRESLKNWEHQKNDRAIKKEMRKNGDTENDAAHLSKTEREEYRRFQEAMFAEGLISEIKPPREASLYQDFPPLNVEGKTASESIIEERR